MPMQNFRSLRVWHKAHALAIDVYRVTESFPLDERFGLTVQLRRAAVSVPSNIAEGCGRTSPADFRRFLTIATGSLSELEYQLLLARDLGYLQGDAYKTLHAGVVETRRMASSLRSSPPGQYDAGLH